MGNEAMAEIKSKGREANHKSQKTRKSVARRTQSFWFFVAGSGVLSVQRSLLVVFSMKSWRVETACLIFNATQLLSSNLITP